MMMGEVGGTGRSPRLDAPPYDPSLWEGKDCAFITTLKDVYHQQQRRERQLSFELLACDVAGTAAAPLPSAFFLWLNSRLSALCSNILARLFPWYYAQRVMKIPDLGRMSNDELVSCMHLVLREGNTELSAVIAKELARRRVHLYDDDGDLGGGGGKGFFMAGSRPSAYPATQNKISVASGGRWRGVVARGGAGHLSDSSLIVPDILLQRRSRSSGRSSEAFSHF